MMYGSLVDSNHTPKVVPRVLEKGRKWRQFVTSKNMQLKIASAVHHIRQRSSAPIDFNQCYIFGRDHSRPLTRDELTTTLDSIAKGAGVEVQVHAHAFRHTIVGKLVEAGNSMELVSKFMGHSNTMTTSSNYWLTNVHQLANTMNNPFMASYHTKEEKKEAYVEELEDAQVKIVTSLKIINIYNQELSKYTIEVPEAAELVHRIRARIPNLANLLDNIARSEGDASTSVASSVSSVALSSL
jgi:hypothetical protein